MSSMIVGFFYVDLLGWEFSVPNEKPYYRSSIRKQQILFFGALFKTLFYPKTENNYCFTFFYLMVISE